MNKFWLLVILLFGASNLYSQDTTNAEKKNEWKISGEIRVRPELDGRDFNNLTYPITYSLLRSRLAVEKSFFNDVLFFVQIQDSRVFGQEKDLQGNIANLDLHQGYILLKNIFTPFLSAQAGRFEMIYGTERFIGLGNWGNVGRSFDGLRISYATEPYKVDAFAITQKSSIGSAQGISNPKQRTYLPFTKIDTSFTIYGLWTTFKPVKDHQIDVFGYIEYNGMKSDTNDPNLNRYTAGLSYFGTFGNLGVILEGAYQGGNDTVMIATKTDTSIRKRDIAAFTTSIQVIYSIKPFSIGVGFDCISGTDSNVAKSKINTYTSSMGTNHKFYGYMDYFTDMPANTLNLGINDYYLTFKYGEKTDRFTGQMNFHYFTSNKPLTNYLIVNNKPSTENLTVFGEELDLVLNYQIVKGANLQWGGSLFNPGELMNKKLFPLSRKNPGFWSYLSATVNF